MFTWQAGEEPEAPYVIINGTKHYVQFTETGETPLTASNLNRAQEELLGDMEAEVAEEFDVNTNYTKGNYCIKNNTIYRAKENITAGPWNPTKWIAVKILDELNNLSTKNIVTAKVNSTTTISQQYNAYDILGYTKADGVGTLLTVDNNGIRIPAGVNKLLLYGQARFDDLVDGDRVFLYINRSRGNAKFSPSANTSGSSGTTTTLTVMPFICSCQEGDYFRLSIQNNGGARGKVDGNLAGSNYSFLTAEVIE